MTREKEEARKAMMALQLKVACYTALTAYMTEAFDRARSFLKLDEFQGRLGQGVKNPLNGKFEPVIDETAAHVDHKRGRVSYAIVPMTDASGAKTGEYRINFVGYGEDGKPAADVELVLNQIPSSRTHGYGGIH